MTRILLIVSALLAFALPASAQWTVGTATSQGPTDYVQTFSQAFVATGSVTGQDLTGCNEVKTTHTATDTSLSIYDCDSASDLPATAGCSRIADFPRANGQTFVNLSFPRGFGAFRVIDAGGSGGTVEFECSVRNLTFTGGSWQATYASNGGAANPGGSDAQFQYNDGGSSFGGISELEYNDSTGISTLDGTMRFRKEGNTKTPVMIGNGGFTNRPTTCWGGTLDPGSSIGLVVLPTNRIATANSITVSGQFQANVSATDPEECEVTNFGTETFPQSMMSVGPDVETGIAIRAGNARPADASFWVEQGDGDFAWMTDRAGRTHYGDGVDLCAGQTMTFSISADTITSSGGTPFADFEVGDYVCIKSDAINATNNGGCMEITAATSTVLTVVDGNIHIDESARDVHCVRAGPPIVTDGVDIKGHEQQVADCGSSSNTGTPSTDPTSGGSCCQAGGDLGTGFQGCGNAINVYMAWPSDLEYLTRIVCHHNVSSGSNVMAVDSVSSTNVRAELVEITFASQASAPRRAEMTTPVRIPSDMEAFQFRLDTSTAGDDRFYCNFYGR